MDAYYTHYYLSQIGGGESDIGEIYKAPYIYQQGRGVGSFFGGIVRYLKPLFSSGLKAVKKQAVKTGKSILSDLGSKPVKDLLKEHGKAAVEELAKQGINKLFKTQDQGGSGLMKRLSIKRRNPSTTLQFLPSRKRRRSSKQVKRSVKRVKSRRKINKNKKRILDIFDN